MQHIPQSYKYPGNELKLFEEAHNWKGYFAQKIIKYIQGNVLEVGAGIGSTTKALNNNTAASWMMLEPDAHLFDSLKDQQTSLPLNCTFFNGSIEDIENRSFDTVLYIDVLEHIENDRQQMLLAANILNAGGNLIILAPAYNFLYSKFDKAIGHFRRYDKTMLKSIMPDSLQTISLQYFDSMGFFASVANKCFLKQAYPTRKQVQLWDKALIPASRMLDPFFFYLFGKSIIGIWKKKAQ